MFDWISTNYIIGYGISVLGGGIVGWSFLKFIRSERRLGAKPPTDADKVKPWLTGFIERTAFTSLVVMGMPGIGTVMMAWLGLKLATNWNHPDFQNNPKARSHAFAALLAGLISMLFAYAGGVYVLQGYLFPLQYFNT